MTSTKHTDDARFTLFMRYLALGNAPELEQYSFKRVVDMTRVVMNANPKEPDMRVLATLVLIQLVNT